MKKTHFSYVPAAIVALLLCVGCKKESDSGSPGAAGSGYYMRFKAGGIQKEFLQNTFGNFNRQQSSNTANYASTFGATKEQFEAKKDNMTLVLVTNGQNMQSLGYTNYTTTAPGFKKGYIVQGAYYDEAGVFYMSWSDDYAAVLPAAVESNMKLTITAATSTELKGVFSGVLYNSDYSKKLVITEGDFYLKVQ